MANSGITKKALASALKELMQKQSFANITVANICEKCGMNRKSFYYHFKDKYDLVNWIFDTECISAIAETDDHIGLEILADVIYHMGENRGFYRATLKIEGQNSFRSHFHETIASIVQAELQRVFADKEVHKLQNVFATAGVVGTLERWILDEAYNDVDSEMFTAQLTSLIEIMTIESYKKKEQHPNLIPLHEGK